MKTLRPYQESAVRIVDALNFHALFFEAGTGKTFTAINILKNKCSDNRRILTTLIVGPKSVVYNWLEEIEDFGNEKLTAATQVLDGTLKKKIKQLTTPGKKIFITSDGATSSEGLWAEIQKKGFELLVLDESHRIKNHQSKRSKRLIALADKATYKFILTGTPITNQPMDIWAQFRFMSKSITDENFYIFRAKFFYDKNAFMKNSENLKGKHFPKWQLRPEKVVELNALIRKHSIAVKKEDVLDLPDHTKEIIKVDQSPEIAEHLHNLEHYLCTIIGDQKVTTKQKITTVMRMQQVCCGTLKTDSGDIKRLDCGKFKALRNILEERIVGDSKAIIWSNWLDSFYEIEKLLELLELEYVVIKGGQTTLERQASIAKFQNDPKIKICLANPQAGGTGINLQAANLAIYFSKGFNLEHDIQSEARNYRSGSEIHDEITRIDLITKDSIEEDIHEALKGKLAVADFVLSLKGKYGKA